MAGAALLSWPFIALAIILTLGPVRGLIWSFLIGYLFLPEAFGYDLPGLPPYTKRTALSVSCLIAYIIARRNPPAQKGTVNRTADVVFYGLTAMLFLSAIMTVLTNQDPIVFTESTLPGLGFRDYISMASSFTFLLLPFLAAREILRDERAHQHLLSAMVVITLLYSLLILFEIRMSPQLHTWVYGYFQHNWNQHVRGGGFRPVVFMKHGLHLGFFLFAVTVAAFSLARARKDQERKTLFLLAGAWLLLMLMISRNLGAASLGLFFVPLLFLASRRVKLWVMAVIAVFLLLMPALQQQKLLPLDTIMETANSVSAERGASLRFRLVNEQKLLERASERPVFGWGIWSRWRIHDARGNDLSTVDGLWISTFGEIGWVGYIAYFGLLTLPLLLLGRVAREREIGPLTIGLGLIVAGNLIYMIPNAAGSPFSWLMAGAVMGFVRWSPAESVAEAAPVSRQEVRYTRFGVTRPPRTISDQAVNARPTNSETYQSRTPS